MSAIRFWKTAKGNLPQLCYIFCNTEPLRTDFKKVACSVTYSLLFIEVQRGKEGVKNGKYQKELVATAACTKRMMEATKGIGQKSIKGGTKDCFLFGRWFASKKATEAAMLVVAELINMVKTNTKVFCKETIENLTKDWPGGSYLLLRSKPMVPGDRPLIAISYKYNAQKVLSFIVTYNTGITKTGIPYLSKYPDQFTNDDIRPVACPVVIYIYNMMSMRLTTTKNQDIIIWHWRSGGLFSVVGCSYLRTLLWE